MQTQKLHNNIQIHVELFTQSKHRVVQIPLILETNGYMYYIVYTSTR